MAAKVFLERATRKDITDANGVKWAIGQPIMLRDAGTNTFHPVAIDPDDRDTYELQDPYKWVGVLLVGAYAMPAGAVVVTAYTDTDYPGPDPVAGVKAVRSDVDDFVQAFTKGAQTYAGQSAGGGNGWLLLLLLGGLVLAESSRGKRGRR